MNEYAYIKYENINYNLISEMIKNQEVVYKIEQKKKIEYYNVSAAFDTETSSVSLKGDEKFAFIYEWTFGVNDVIIWGRTVEEFADFITKLSFMLDKKVVVYVHNLSFDFQFIRDYFEWEKVFKLKDRAVVYARLSNIEFRCSYLESDLSLAKIGKNIGIDKKAGDLDYELIRTPDTDLTNVELDYCFYDVIILLEYIKKRIKQFDGVQNIQYTKTAYVRKKCKNELLRNKEFNEMIKKLKLTEDEYIQMKQCFAGGFSHSNYIHTCDTLHNVVSFDFESSYPAVLVSEKFPISKGKRVKIKNEYEFWFYLSEKCCMFSLYITNLKSKEKGDNILSVSKCIEYRGVIQDNGRIVSADSAIVIVNEIDFINLLNFYDFNYQIVGDFWIYEKGYLPSSFLNIILELYETKTKLKGKKDKIEEYRLAKENLNSIYGMLVTDIIKYDDEDITKNLKKYNNSMSRFSFFPWGVWATSYARRNLFSGILECGDDYIYSDTDSIKIMNYEKHSEYFEKYNKNMQEKIRKALNNAKLSYKCEKLGIWDREDDIKRIKTLGSKRYIIEKENGEYMLTCAGLDKQKGLEFLKKTSTDPFLCFNDGLNIPASETGKKVHTYIDYEITAKIKDYKGKKCEVKAKSGVHLENTSFCLGIDEYYIQLLNGVKDESLIFE